MEQALFYQQYVKVPEEAPGVVFYDQILSCTIYAHLNMYHDNSGTIENASKDPTNRAGSLLLSSLELSSGSHWSHKDLSYLGQPHM